MAEVKVNKKGQMIIIALFIFFVALVIVAILLEPIIAFIDIGVNATVNTTHGSLIATLLNYIPVFVVLTLIVSLFAMITTR